MRFVDTNVFIYTATAHPSFEEVAKRILERINAGESAITSTLVLCEVAWVLEAMDRQSDIKPTLEKYCLTGTLKWLGLVKMISYGEPTT